MLNVAIYSVNKITRIGLLLADLYDSSGISCDAFTGQNDPTRKYWKRHRGAKNIARVDFEKRGKTRRPTAASSMYVGPGPFVRAGRSQSGKLSWINIARGTPPFFHRNAPSEPELLKNRERFVELYIVDVYINGRHCADRSGYFIFRNYRHCVICERLDTRNLWVEGRGLSSYYTSI